MMEIKLQCRHYYIHSFLFNIHIIFYDAHRFLDDNNV